MNAPRIRAVYVNAAGQELRVIAFRDGAGRINRRVVARNLMTGKREEWTARLFLAEHNPKPAGPPPPAAASSAPSCPSCGAPLELQEVTEANRFGDRKRAAVASCTGCEFITEVDWRIVAAANLAAGGRA